MDNDTNTTTGSSGSLGSMGSTSSLGSTGTTPFPPSSDSTGRDPAKMDRMVRGAHDTVDRLAESAAPHVQRLQRTAEELRHTGDEWSESLRTTVRANPLASLATALAVGMVLAKITS